MLNKLATNVGQGRNWAGIHWRSDAAASLPQAEEVAIGLLRDEKFTFHEPFDGLSFSRFDGTRVRSSGAERVQRAPWPALVSL